LHFQVLISRTQLLLSVFSRPSPQFQLYTDLCDLFGLHVSEEKILDEIALLPLLTDVFEHDIYGNLLFTAIFGVNFVSLYPKLSEPEGENMSLSED
jgi:hypothetical protein